MPTVPPDASPSAPPSAPSPPPALAPQDAPLPAPPSAPPRPSTRARLAAALALALALGFLGSALTDLRRIPRLNAAVAIDILPIWLGGRALAGGEDPNDAAVLARIFEEQGLHFRTGGFLSYYPPTAALIARPFSAVPYPLAAKGFRYASVLALIAAAVLAVRSAPSRGRVHAVVATIALVGYYLSVRPTRAVLPAGQIGPIVLFATALALWGLSRGRDRIGGIALALGAGIKLFPLVLLPAALGRPRVLVAAALVGALLVGGVALSAPHLDLDAWTRALYGFVNLGVHAAWRHDQPAWVLRLWQARFLALGIPSFLAVVWAWRRRTDPAVATALGALFIAWGGTVMAGSHHYHEALLLLPAVAWVLVWPAQRGPVALSWGLAVGVAVLAELLGTRAQNSAPSSLHWLLVGYATWIACAIRLGWTVRAATSPVFPAGATARRA